MEDILALFRANKRLMRYTPNERDWIHIDRKWICDVLFTLDKANFLSRIHDAQVMRREKLDRSRDLVVEMRPEFASALESCLNFSSKYLNSMFTCDS